MVAYRYGGASGGVLDSLDDAKASKDTLGGECEFSCVIIGTHDNANSQSTSPTRVVKFISFEETAPRSDEVISRKRSVHCYILRQDIDLLNCWPPTFPFPPRAQTNSCAFLEIFRSSDDDHVFSAGRPTTRP